MRRPMRLTVRVRRALLLAGAPLLGTVAARAQTAKGGKIDPTWLRADAASKTVEFKLVAGLTDANGGMNSTVLLDRKSTRLNSSHPSISYAVFCLKKKKKKIQNDNTLNYREANDRRI